MTPPRRRRDDAAVSRTTSAQVVDHFYWGLWGICQSLTEGDAEFPYLTYAKNRLERGFSDAAAIGAV